MSTPAPGAMLMISVTGRDGYWLMDSWAFATGTRVTPSAHITRFGALHNLNPMRSISISGVVVVLARYSFWLPHGECAPWSGELHFQQLKNSFSAGFHRHDGWGRMRHAS